MKIACDICPHECYLAPGQAGLCRARVNRGTKVELEHYGSVTAIALDPIEKKPLRRFYPGSRILSIGGYGCNLACPFCQNHAISMGDSSQVEFVTLMPEELVDKAKQCVSMGNIGIAYTYNEPLIAYEYVADCAKLAASHGLKNVLVSNGYVREEPLRRLLPWIDAMNIDLKGFTDGFYERAHGNLDAVKRTIELAAANCHVEITTLVIPGENDSEGEIRALAKWLSGIDAHIPLHLTRFFPRYQYADRAPTREDVVKRLAEVAREYLSDVY